MEKEKDIYKWEINDVSWLEFYSNDDGTYSIENWADYCDTPEFWIDDATSLDNAIDRVEKYWKALENVEELI